MRKKLFLTTILLSVILFGVSAHTTEAATVGGVVLDARGNAVIGALVVIQQTDVVRGQRPYAARIVSDRRGSFVFDGIPGGHYVVSATTRLGAVRTQVALRAEAVERVQLVIPGRGVKIRGFERD